MAGNNRQQWQEASHETLLKTDISSAYRELGVDVCGTKPSARGWTECRAFGVEDRTPSAGICVADGPLLGRYKDFRSGECLGLFDFAATKAGKFGGDWREARRHYARAAGVELPSGGDEELVADRFEFLDPTPVTLHLALKLYAEGKPGITPEAIRQVGARLARWPKKLSADRTNHVFAFPMYGGGDLLDLEPVGWHCVAQNPKMRIRQFQGKGHEDRLLDKMTVGTKGLMNVDGLARLADADVVNVTEGITDLLACQAVLGEWRAADPDNRRDVVLSAGACTNHPEADWVQHFAGKEIRLWFDVGDAKNEGQIGAAVWVKAMLPVAKEVRNVQLPLGKDDGKNDLRAWLVETGGNYQDMLDYAAGFAPIDPADTAAQASPHEAILKNLGIIVIGEYEGRSMIEVFSEHRQKSATIFDIDKLSLAKLGQLVGPEVVEQYVHDGRECPPDKYDLKMIRMAIAYAASERVSPDPETARWVGELLPALYDKLSKVGLVPRRAAAEQATLGRFLESYISSRSDVKDGTATVYGHTRRCLIEHFGASTPLAEITPGDADEWRLYLSRPKDEDGQGLGPNTIRRRCGIAKQFFRAAHRRKLIAENPFADMKGLTVQGNRERFYFISQSDAHKVLENCPDAQWKLLFALSRYGGLRCTSEHFALRWQDIDWVAATITVHSPKTAHHDGKESRVIPLFPELRPYLEATRDEVNPGYDVPLSSPVITRYRHANANLRTQLKRIIKKAGLKPWPKLFHNLRSTRQTELAELHPAHVVCAWMGNSIKIADEHYLQVTPEHFRRALQNPVQHTHASDCTEAHGESETSRKHDCIDEPVSPAGLEPTTYGLKVRCSTN